MYDLLIRHARVVDGSGKPHSMRILVLWEAYYACEAQLSEEPGTF